MDSTREFIDAVKRNDVDQLKSLLKADITLVYSRSDEDLSAFILAIYGKNRGIAKLLLSSGLTLDVFEAAAYGDSLRVGELLKDKPSLLNEYSPDGWTPLHLAAYFGNRKVTELLLDLEADVLLSSKNAMKVTALHSALSNKQWDIARLLIQRGADIHKAVAGSLYTPLHYAVANGGFEITKFLVSLGVNIAAKSSDGKTALLLAQEMENWDIVHYLQHPLVD
jgi:uncharacterized protein